MFSLNLAGLLHLIGVRGVVHLGDQNWLNLPLKEGSSRKEVILCKVARACCASS